MKHHPWKQINISYPDEDPRRRERHAVDHLSSVLPAAETDGLITNWWYVRKGDWRVRYLPTDGGDSSDPIRERLTHDMTWTPDIYEPETHAFGGQAGMTTAHTLFHRDSRHLLTYLRDNPTDRREHSLILCTALMRTAGLDLNEQGDVWAQVAEQRAGLPNQPPAPDPQIWATFTSDVRHLLLGTARPAVINTQWIASFEGAGRELRILREYGLLTRGIRAVIALHVIFHWNRIGLSAPAQATLANAAQEAIFCGA